MKTAPPPVPLSEMFAAAVTRELDEQLKTANLNLDKLAAWQVLDFAQRLSTCKMSHLTALSIRLAFTRDTGDTGEVIQRTVEAVVRDTIADFKASQHVQIFSQPPKHAPAQ